MKGEVWGAVRAQNRGVSREGVSRLRPLSRTGPAKQQEGENFIKHILRMCPDPSHISHLPPTSTPRRWEGGRINPILQMRKLSLREAKNWPKIA